MKRSALYFITAMSMAGTAAAAETAPNDWTSTAHDAWLDGKVETTLLLNTNLNSFDINTDVKHSTVTLTGKVDSEVDKSLAEELALGVSGVSDVDNKLTVLGNSDESSEVMANLKDSKITTVLTTRLLMEPEVTGTAIDVDTDNGVVTLNGVVNSDAERDLAIQIATNTNDVKQVVNHLAVSNNS